MTPHFDACLVCEQARPELNGKAILLGYFGICPNVNIWLARLDQPTVLTFVLSGGPGEGTFEASFDVVDDKEFVVASTVPMPFSSTPLGPTSVGAPLLLTFGHAGTFAFRCFVEGEERFRGYFGVTQAPVGQLSPV